MPVRNMPSKGSGTPDRGYRRAEATHLVKVGEISADQRAEAASDIGKRRRYSLFQPWLSR
jgi:hypothetical protein